MTDLPFVDWDRAVEWIYEGRKCMNIYGWIERENDQYKDFVLIGVVEKEDVEEAEVIFHGTSSAEYSEEIHKRLFPKDDLDEMHNECFRLEKRFDVENLIQLDERGENLES
jgi:hypothetical protein